MQIGHSKQRLSSHIIWKKTIQLLQAFVLHIWAVSIQRIYNVLLTGKLLLGGDIWSSSSWPFLARDKVVTDNDSWQCTQVTTSERWPVRYIKMYKNTFHYKSTWELLPRNLANRWTKFVCNTLIVQTVTLVFSIFIFLLFNFQPKSKSILKT